MSPLDPDRWRVYSTHLDHALELPDDEARAAWLASLSDTDPGLATELRELLDRERALRREGFLEHGPIPRLASATLAGQQVGNYTVIEPIGYGGMGSVWLAERSDGRFDRRVAVKFLSLTLIGHGEARFRREGLALARLAHPHIAQLLDAGVHASGQPYLVIEHVDGEPIDRYCDRHALHVPGRLRLFLDVLAAVAHAHANLIIHRDLKPSNVLVDGHGHVKLLDFGIAKLLDDGTGDATAITGDHGAALTFQYAAPEQLTGAPVTTATDVYALGVLLFVLLTGRHPAGEQPSSADIVRAVLEREPPLASQVARALAAPSTNARHLRGDLDTILAKALRKSPDERYRTVTELAEDIGRHLRHEPIDARRDARVYRAGRFLRRHWQPVTASILIVAALVSALYVANRQRLIAERRFEQVRQLAQKLLDVDTEVRSVPGAVKARQLIVDTALDYLNALASDVGNDPGLALDVATAYLRVARVQGVPITTHLGQSDMAEQSLRRAEALIAPALTRAPLNRTALIRRAQIAHHRMILAGLRRPNDEALPLAKDAASWLDRYLDSGPAAEGDVEDVVMIASDVGNRFRIAEQYEDALRSIRVGLDVARAFPASVLPSRLGGLLVSASRTSRDLGNIEEALAESQEAARVLEPLAVGGSVQPTFTFTLALSDQAAILSDPNGASLGRPAEAIAMRRRAFAILDGLAHRDANDAESRLRLVSNGNALALLLRFTDAQEAVSLYDHLLRHMSEVPGNPRFRRDEIRAWAGSAAPLQRLGRRDEAKRRLDSAFARLRDLGFYPAPRVELGSEADDALRALAEDEGARGSLVRAGEIYADFVARVTEGRTRADTSLDSAVDLSGLYSAAADAQRRAGRPDSATALDAQRLALWQGWAQRLPRNRVVLLHYRRP